MTKICGDASLFAAAALNGFCRAYPQFVRGIQGGVVRAQPAKAGKVSLIVGGGAGHYPSFIGFVGEGMADAGVPGDVFASPSSQAIIRVARAAHQGGGVLLAFGNYAGDVLNFSIAAERLNNEGIETRLLITSDDIASAPAECASQRRGIAGNIVIFKIVGAAAEAGLSLEAVAELGQRANLNTRTLGVAFDGCTLPGETDKLFHVPENVMAIGLGIHGEPGIDTMPVQPPEKLAELLVERLLKEAPPNAGRRVAVLLNGLGATKYEELFVLWGAVHAILVKKGFEPVAPLVGEYITSLDMAGCSLSITWLDDVLEPLWLASVRTPALSRDAKDATFIEQPQSDDFALPCFDPTSSEEGRRGGRCVAGAIVELAKALKEAESTLGHIDAAAGDGDHGQGMARGSAAAALMAEHAAKSGAGPRTVLAAAGDAWADRAGGTSGALWGAGLHAFSEAFDDCGIPDGIAIMNGLVRGRDTIMRLGKAEVGDKTLIDALVPLVDGVKTAISAGKAIKQALAEGAERATHAAEATKDLIPRRGRARTHGKRSLGHPDAGAISLALSARVLAQYLAANG